MDYSPLDKPIWNALTTAHQSMARVHGHARRYASDVSPMSALAEPSAEAFDDLRKLVEPGNPVGLFSMTPLEVPSPWEVTWSGQIDQMVWSKPGAAPPAVKMRRLTDADVPDMLALTAATEPGPFLPRTITMGRYYGVRSPDGRLAAMAGTRLKLDRFTEISAVCTHPEFRGRGYAHALVDHLANEIRSEGSTPFLHMRSDNPARSVYHKAGFVERSLVYVTLLTPKP